ncbi:efflux RND transporter periplasmic adaptor subunit [Gemmatimonadota bacterium]
MRDRTRKGIPMALRAKSLLKFFIIVVILGAVATAVYLRIQKEKAEEAEGTPASAVEANAGDRDAAVEGLFRGIDPIPVRATPTVLGTLVQTVHAEGRAQPLRQVNVVSQVSGIMDRLRVKEGDYIREGQVLMELDREEYELALENAQASYLRAQADYAANYEERDTVEREGLEVPQPTMDPQAYADIERRFQQAERQLQNNEINKEAFDIIELEYMTARILAGYERGNIQQAELTSSRITLQRAQRDLDLTMVKAPFSGWVADLLVAEGQYIGGSTPLLTLLDLSRIRVDVDVLESEISPLRAGRRAEVTFTALKGDMFEGVVISVNPMINSQTRTGKVKLELENPEGRITSGMFARARIFSRDIEDVMMVPHESIVERDERTLVFAVVESEDEETPDIVKWRYVILGESNDTHVIVLPTDDPHAGVSEGMLVCIEGHVSLQHDSPVVLTEVEPPSVITP